MSDTLRWSPKLAYAIGLIATDGSISKDGRHIDFTSKDYQLLSAFKKCLSLTNKISAKSNYQSNRRYFHIQFCNAPFYRWLNKIGIKTNKTRSIARLKIPALYMRDFLRGHLDGDGSIFTYKDTYASYRNKQYTFIRLYTAFNSTSEKHLTWIRETIKRQLGIQGGLTSFCGKTRKLPLWTLRFAKNDSIKLLRWLYYNDSLPCLVRKRKIAEQFI
jgi:hypothetical protein